MSGYDYSKMTQEDFDRILEDMVNELSVAEILAVPGVYEAMAEEFNNRVLDTWADSQETAP